MGFSGRKNGSTLVFVICGVLLVLIALGVLYGAKRVAMNDQTPPMELPTSSESSDKKTDDKNNSSSDTGKTEDKQADKPDSSGSTSSGSSSTSTDSSSNSSTSASESSTSASHLPQTGPEDAVVSMLGLALITASAVAFVRSRGLI